MIRIPVNGVSQKRIARGILARKGDLKVDAPHVV